MLLFGYAINNKKNIYWHRMRFLNDFLLKMSLNKMFLQYLFKNYFEKWNLCLKNLYIYYSIIYTNLKKLLLP